MLGFRNWILRFTKMLMFVVKDAYDYQGRSFLHIPQDTGVNLKSDSPPEKCFLPKKHIHTWSGHTKGVAAIRWFPRSAHLLLSCSMDTKIKVRIIALVSTVPQSCGKSCILAYFLRFCENVPHFWVYFEITKIAENGNNFSCIETFCSKKVCENINDSVAKLFMK